MLQNTLSIRQKSHNILWNLWTTSSVSQLQNGEWKPQRRIQHYIRWIFKSQVGKAGRGKCRRWWGCFTSLKASSLRYAIIWTRLESSSVICRSSKQHELRGEGRNTPEQMGSKKQHWKRNAENCSWLPTHLETGRATGRAVRPFSWASSLSAKEGLGFNTAGISCPWGESSEFWFASQGQNSLYFDLAIWKYLPFCTFTDPQQDITPVDSKFWLINEQNFTLISFVTIICKKKKIIAFSTQWSDIVAVSWQNKVWMMMGWYRMERQIEKKDSKSSRTPFPLSALVWPDCYVAWPSKPPQTVPEVWK